LGSLLFDQSQRSGVGRLSDLFVLVLTSLSDQESQNRLEMLWLEKLSGALENLRDANSVDPLVREELDLNFELCVEGVFLDGLACKLVDEVPL
jgi:hypothetical protein